LVVAVEVAADVAVVVHRDVLADILGDEKAAGLAADTRDTAVVGGGAAAHAADNEKAAEDRHHMVPVVVEIVEDTAAAVADSPNAIPVAAGHVVVAAVAAGSTGDHWTRAVVGLHGDAADDDRPPTKMLDYRVNQRNGVRPQRERCCQRHRDHHHHRVEEDNDCAMAAATMVDHSENSGNHHRWHHLRYCNKDMAVDHRVHHAAAVAVRRDNLHSWTWE
jgi:hypothetical protein